MKTVNNFLLQSGHALSPAALAEEILKDLPPDVEATRVDDNLLLSLRGSGKPVLRALDFLCAAGVTQLDYQEAEERVAAADSSAFLPRGQTFAELYGAGPFRRADGVVTRDGRPTLIEFKHDPLRDRTQDLDQRIAYLGGPGLRGSSKSLTGLMAALQMREDLDKTLVELGGAFPNQAWFDECLPSREYCAPLSDAPGPRRVDEKRKERDRRAAKAAKIARRKNRR